MICHPVVGCRFRECRSGEIGATYKNIRGFVLELQDGCFSESFALPYPYDVDQLPLLIAAGR